MGTNIEEVRITELLTARRALASCTDDPPIAWGAEIRALVLMADECVHRACDKVMRRHEDCTHE